MRYLVSFLVLSFGFFSAVFAQQDTIVNPNSIERIPYYEQLYRFRVWRVVDLNEKQNAGFKSVRSDIADFLISNIQNGSLPIFDETVENPNDPAVALVMNTAIVEPPYDPKKSYLASETASYNGKNYISSRNGNVGKLPTDTQWWDLSTDQTTFFSKADVKALTIIEDVIFDKRRSRLYYDIQAIGLLAQKAGSTNIDPIAFIQYKDFYNLVEKAAHSKDVKERDKVMWRNRYNPSENRSYVDAFKLRLFHGVVEKVENPDDRSITQIYELNGRTYGESIFARWEEEMKMMEKEHNLWEY